MEHANVFSSDHEIIQIAGLGGIIQFAGYHPHKPELFPDGIELAADLITNTGTILYARGTQLSPQRIARLARLMEVNGALNFSFKLKRTQYLLDICRTQLKDRLNTLFDHRIKSPVFAGLFEGIRDELMQVFDTVMQDEQVLLAAYKMMFLARTCKAKQALTFFDHSLDVAILSDALLRYGRYDQFMTAGSGRAEELFRTALFHNYGAMLMIENVLLAPDEDIRKAYRAAVREGFLSLGMLPLSDEVAVALRYVCDYQTGQRRFLARTEWPAIMASVVVIAESFLEGKSGLFGPPLHARDIVDRINVTMAKNGMHPESVIALTRGMQLSDLLDFYRELKRIRSLCEDHDAVPYPMSGFKSPTMFICTCSGTDCENLEGSLKAVTLIQPMGTVRAGQYHRCSKLTGILNQFYREHYSDIKRGKQHAKVTPTEPKRSETP